MNIIKSFLTLVLSLCMLTVPFADQDQNPVFDPEAEYHMSLNTSKFETHAVTPSPFTKSFLNHPGKAANIFSVFDARCYTHFIPRFEVQSNELILKKTCAIPVKYQSNYLS
ncbi:hypothetical protein [Bacillus haynesii]|uniref:hypothetical protein n=1 Tax=Bacillus haynesii TaxID=1925021 RepID=UPI00227FA14C|nr:hypothetical protein [Bacillus haynesii]MCY7816453.1 hypothetical protein [Bacillus haynesii]MCY8223395.1 hypothetical protein [Bacillus haynesii]MCY8665040.1 hypothetical protein [Bacillus haynesii]MEC1344407.1 hypothetical protein [Bacillus haynesii]